MVALAFSLARFAPSAQTPVRDARTEPIGTASISGIVQTSESTPRPLRLAAVTLSGDQLLADRQFFTGNDGHFEFSNLPPGQYRVTAFKTSYMREAYGAKRQGGAGASIALGSGQTLTGVSIGLSKYGVITGTIYDQNGEPAQGVSVEVMAYTMRTGRRTLSSVYGRPQTTDDRGVYRAGGLVPGDYFVAAGPSSFDENGDLRVLSADDVDRTLQARSLAGPGSSPNAVAAATSTHVSFAPVFFPGATSLSGATKIALRLGEERTDVDFALRLVPTVRIDGTVTGLDGQPVTNAQIVATLVTDAFSLDLFRGTLGSTRPDARGRFSYPGVSPGHYVITARSAPDQSAGSSSTIGPLWAMAETDVNGADQSVALMLQPGVSVSGKVVFDGTTLKPPATMSSLRVTMPAVQTAGVSIGPSPPAINPDGSFTITGAPPGRYKLTATAPAAPTGWMLRSAIVNGVDALDVPLDLKPNQPIDGMIVTFTDHPTELSGTLQTSTGVPTANYFIIVFATDRAFWTPSSRRTVMARPGTTGRYAVRNLPPGEYFVAALTDVEFNAWFDPAFLEQLVAASTRVTLAESQKLTLDLKIVGPG
jgi:hypothetical protein